MTVEEMQKMRAEVEQLILKAIREFEEATHLSVLSVETERVQTTGISNPARTKTYRVHLQVEL